MNRIAPHQSEEKYGRWSPLDRLRPVPRYCDLRRRMNDTIKPFLAAKGHEQPVVNGMHRAWCKSVQLQLALWAKPYSTQVVDEW